MVSCVASLGTTFEDPPPKVMTIPTRKRCPWLGCDTPVDPWPGVVTRNEGRSFQNFSEMRGLVLKFTRFEFLFDYFLVKKNIGRAKGFLKEENT